MEQRIKKIEEEQNKMKDRLKKVESFIETGLSKTGKLIRCSHCGHSWKTKSKAKLVSCPHCGNKTKI